MRNGCLVPCYRIVRVSGVEVSVFGAMHGALLVPKSGQFCTIRELKEAESRRVNQ